MRFLASAWGRSLASSAAVLLCCSLASAQGFKVRELNITSEQVNDHTEALQFIGDPRTDPKAFEASFDGTANFATLNFGGGNNFGGDEPFPDGGPNNDSREDYILYATAQLDFSNADGDFFAIGFGSDDGGQLTLEGVEFLDFINVQDGGELAFDIDQIAFNGNRGHGWTYGTFEKPNGIVNFNASMHERGGGDSFEVAIRQTEDDFAPEAFNASEWTLLRDGVFGINVVVDGKGVIAIDGDGLGEMFVDPQTTTLVREPATGDYAPGLAQEWSKSGNAGNRAGIIAARAGAGIDPAPFRAADTDWWFGNERRTAHLQDAGIPSYPVDVESAGYVIGDAADNNEYSVMLTGEMNFENTGEYSFRDGVDDYTYFAVDTNGSGVAGDAPEEVLIDDNAWTDADGVTDDNGGNASPLVSVDIADAGWKAVEFLMAEGGGSDAGILYWTGGDGDKSLLTPDNATGPVDDADLLPQQTHTRSKLPGAITGTSFNAKVDGALNDFEMQVSSDLLDSDHILVNGAGTPGVETTLDIGDITVNVVADGELVAGDEWVLFGADNIIGLDTVTLNFADPSQWDTSNLGVNGRIKYLGAHVSADCNGDGVVDASDFACGYRPELAGDLNANGSVEFDDFLILSANFGQQVAGYGEGDISGNGSVDFEDFLALSSNFGVSGNGVAAAVPEPSSLLLLSLAGLLAGLVRRRR